MGERMLIPAAAKRTGLSEHALRTGCKQGKYPHLKVGNRTVIDLDWLEEYLRQEATDSIKPQEGNEVVNYGKLRKIEE